MQSRAYAYAAAHTYGQRPVWAKIYIDDHVAGLVQIMEAKILWGALHAVTIDRGPLWFAGFGTDAHMAAFVKALNALYPKRLGRSRRIIPESPASPRLMNALQAAGFDSVGAEGYQTVWLDITGDEKTLRLGLHKKWRYSLRKSEEAPITIEWDRTAKALPWLLKHYHIDKTRRGYSGPDATLVKALAQSFARYDQLLIGTALLDERPIAAILILCHGQSATYQIGYSSKDGRTHCAHHRLLFEALAQLRGIGITDLDLGGVNDADGSGVKKFKSGLGGEPLQLAGLFT